MLHSNAATQRNHSIDISIADCLRMIEEPVHSIERNIAVYLFKNIERAFYRFVIGCVQAERPARRRKMANDCFEFAFQHSAEVRPRLDKVFEVRS